MQTLRHNAEHQYITFKFGEILRERKVSEQRWIKWNAYKQQFQLQTQLPIQGPA